MSNKKKNIYYEASRRRVTRRLEIGPTRALCVCLSVCVWVCACVKKKDVI